MSWGTAQKWYSYNRKTQAWCDWTQTGNTATTATFEVEGCARSGDGSGQWYASGYTANVEIWYKIGSGGWHSLGSTSGTLNYGDEVGYISRSVTITRTDEYQTVVFACDVTSPSGYWPKATSQLSVEVWPITYSAPYAPSSCSATRSSDSKASVTWTNGSTDTTHPRTATLVERQTDAGSWTQIASVGSSTSNYADNGIGANHRYRYRVRAKNSAGTSSYSTSGYIYTTPAAPTKVSLSKTAATTVQVSISGAAPYATGYDVQRKAGSGDWTTIASATSMPYTDSSVPAGTVQYRVRAVRSSLASAWKTSDSIVTVTAPLAPTITEQPAAVLVAGSTATIAWAPNHPDGSAQSSAQVLVTDPDGTTSTADISGATTTYTLTPSSTGVWSAQVRTHGLADEWGAWSDAITWRVADLPVVTITEPATDGTTITAMPLTIAWTVTDPSGTSAQSLSIVGSTGTVYSAQGITGTSVTLDASDVAMATGESYEIELRVTSGYGLSVTETRTFAVAWTPPAPPTMTITEGEGASASILVEFGTEGDVATAYVDVSRVNSDGTTWLVASGVGDGESVIDPLPPIGLTVEYVATASAASGATASATASSAFGGSSWLLNFGDAAGESVALRYNPSASYQLDHGGEAYHFADGGAGSGRPVWYGTTDRDESGTLKFDTVGPGESDMLRVLIDAHPVCWLRDPFGHRWRAHVTPSVSHGVSRIWQVSVKWDAVRMREAW